jgi:hypothetical protein
LGSKCRQFRIRDRDHSFPPFLKSHWGRGDFDLKTSIACPDFQRLTGFQAEGLSQWFWHNDPAGSINSGFHGMKNGIKMARMQPMA